MSVLGAINKITKEYIYPKIANKDDKYICPECNKDLIFRHGKINIPHFAHAKDNQKCDYYDKPSETQIHKDAKMLLKKLLENKQNIKFIRKCNNGCCIKKYKIQYLSDTIEILLEYKFNFNNSNKIADVAYIDNNEIKCLFEICHTNKTKECDRPEPWFEINATELIKQINEIDNNTIKINCIRQNINCKNSKIKENYIDLSKLKIITGTEKYKIFCSACSCIIYEPSSFESSDSKSRMLLNNLPKGKIVNEPYQATLDKLPCTALLCNEPVKYNNISYDLCKYCLYNNNKYKNLYNQINKEITKIKKIPALYKKYGAENSWKQNLKCTICERSHYSPYYYKYKFYAICKLCFNQNNTNYNIILNKD